MFVKRKQIKFNKLNFPKIELFMVYLQTSLSHSRTLSPFLYRQ